MAETSQADVPRARLEQEYTAAFLPYGLVPVMLPRGQDVGDVIARLDGSYVARGDECFPGLVPREAPSSLTAVDVSWKAAAQLALGVDSVAAAEAQGNVENRVQVRFEKVHSRSASLTQLRNTVKPSVVPEVALLLSQDKVAFEKSPDWLLIGEVLSAVTVVRVTRSRAAGAKADLGFLQRLFGSGVKAKVAGDLSKSETAEIRTEESLPVAFRPARIKLTPEIANDFKKSFALDQFDPNEEAHRLALSAWVAVSISPIGPNFTGRGRP